MSYSMSLLNYFVTELVTSENTRQLGRKKTQERSEEGNKEGKNW